MSETNGHSPLNGPAPDFEGMTTELKALKAQLASVRKLCEAGWPRCEPCRLCTGVGTHADTCYVRASTGYDLLEEHETTVRDNERFRAALAQFLPHQAKHIIRGGVYRSLRDRARKPGRFSSQD